MTSNAQASHVKAGLQDGILRIMMNRPEKKNALTISMYSDLTDAIESGERESAVRVLLIHGAGGCFTSGKPGNTPIQVCRSRDDGYVFR